MSEASLWRGEGEFERPDATWDEAAPQSEQRTAPRFTLLIRTAKLICARGEYFCIIRDVSKDGIKVRTFHPLPRETAFTIELASGEQQKISKVWEDGDLVGFSFAEQVPIDRLLAEAPEGLRKRTVRLRLALPVTIRSQGREIAATFVDISQHGACIACDDHLAMNERVGLVTDCLPALDARIRWRRRPLYGVIFEQTFRFDELGRLTAPHQPGAVRGGATLRICRT